MEQYLQHIVSLPLEDASDICEFLSTDVMDTRVYQATGQKEGYLTKRGKNFGGWKTRYFVLNENVLEYYESVSLVKNMGLTAGLLMQFNRKKELSSALFVLQMLKSVVKCLVLHPLQKNTIVCIDMHF